MRRSNEAMELEVDRRCGGLGWHFGVRTVRRHSPQSRGAEEAVWLAQDPEVVHDALQPTRFLGRCGSRRNEYVHADRHRPAVAAEESAR